LAGFVLPGATWTQSPETLFDLVSIDILVILAALSFGACHWVAAKALIEAEASERRAVGTFLLMVCLVIGVWFLRPRVLALSNSDPGLSAD